MTIWKATPLLASLALFGSWGCGPGTGSDELSAAMPKFEGKVDERFVGHWKTSDERSKYEFSKDGRYSLESKVRTPNGTLDTKSAGDWLISDDRFLIRDANGNIASYRWTIQGGKLKLALTGSLKNETVLIRI